MPPTAKPRSHRLSRLGLLSLLAAFALIGAARERSISITLDDLPYTSQQDDSLIAATSATDALLQALRTHEAPADLFVIGEQVQRGEETEARGQLLATWQAQGHRLHNHSLTHPAYSKLGTQEYLQDVNRGEALVERLRTAAPEGADYRRYYRAPFNDLGATADQRTALEAQLRQGGIALAQFTVQHDDWLFDQAYSKALAEHDQALAARIGHAYLQQLDLALDFAEELSVDTFGREIPQVLLLHANRLNADHLGQMLDRLQTRGYRFVTLEQATADPAYASADTYVGKWGFSWLHRWRMAMHRPNRLAEEPEAPAWISAPTGD